MDLNYMYNIYFNRHIRDWSAKHEEGAWRKMWNAYLSSGIFPSPSCCTTSSIPHPVFSSLICQVMFLHRQIFLEHKVAHTAPHSTWLIWYYEETPLCHQSVIALYAYGLWAGLRSYQNSSRIKHRRNDCAVFCCVCRLTFGEMSV